MYTDETCIAFLVNKDVVLDTNIYVEFNNAFKDKLNNKMIVKRTQNGMFDISESYIYFVKEFLNTKSSKIWFTSIQDIETGASKFPEYRDTLNEFKANNRYLAEPFFLGLSRLDDAILVDESVEVLNLEAISMIVYGQKKFTDKMSKDLRLIATIKYHMDIGTIKNPVLLTRDLNVLKADLVYGFRIIDPKVF